MKGHLTPPPPSAPSSASRPSAAGWLRAVAIALAATAAGILAASAYAAHRLATPRRAPPTPAPQGPYEAVTFNASDGVQLHGWFLPGNPEGLPLVISHGFHTSRREGLPVGIALRDRGHNVLLFDFRAHGESDGQRTSCGPLETRDLEGAVGYLLRRPEVKGDRAGVIGYSMGAAIALMVAAGVPAIGAVVADSSFASIRGALPHYFRAAFPLPAFPFAHLALWFGERLVGVKADAIRPVEAIGKIAPRPVLLIHGVEDRLVPLSEAFRLYEAAGEQTGLWTVAGAGHAAARELDFQGYLDRVDHFFRRHLLDCGA